MGVNRARPMKTVFIVNCILDAGYRSMREKSWVTVSYE